MIGNFNPPQIRNDTGELWENYIITERLKKREFLRKHGNVYYWRTYDRQEIDLVEESAGQITGYEVK